MEIINSIIRFSLKNRLTIFLGALLLIVGGIVSWQRMDIDVFPDLTAPTVVVMTDAHGMAAEEVERLVTFPIETAVNGATACALGVDVRLLVRMGGVQLGHRCLSGAADSK